MVPSRARPLLSLFGALACALLCATACDTGPEPGKEAEYWGKRLTDPDPKKRDQAMKHLMELKDVKSLPFLHEVMKGENVDLKPEAALLLSAIGDESSVEPLLAGIDWSAGAGRDKNSKKAALANERIAKALGNVAKPDDKKVIDALKRLALSNRLETQLAAVHALGELRAKDAVQDLIDIADGHENNYMVKNAVIALGKIADPKAVPVLIKLLFFERGVSFYREASYALFEIGEPAVAPLLQVYEGNYEPIQELHIDEGVQRAKAIEVLTDIGDQRVVKLAMESGDIPVTDTASALTRAKAHVALGKLGVKEAVPILTKHWDDVDVSKSEFAVAAIAQIGAREVLPQLIAMTTHDGFIDQCVRQQKNDETRCRFSEAQIRKPRLEAISRLGTGETLAAWEQMIENAKKLIEEEKKKAAEAKDDKEKKVAEKAQQGHEKTLQLLEERKPMLEAAKECGKKLDCWIGKLKSDNARVREKAGYELLYAKDLQAVKALTASLGDPDNEARYAAILALWRTLPKGELAANAMQRIDQILEEEQGKTQYVRINEDLKRLRVKLARGY